MDIAEYIYEGVVEPSYKQPTREDTTHAGHRRENRLESTSSHTYSAMIENTGKHRKRYVDHLERESKICLMYGSGYSSDECKVLGDLCSKYVKSRPTKDRGHDTVPRNKFNIQQENNSIVNSAVDEILLY